jgi:hypothetical protein
MKKYIIISMLFASCGVKEKATENLIESAIEKSSGQKVDIDNIMENSQKQSASGNFSFDGKVIINESTNFTGSTTFQKDNNGITIGTAMGSEDGKQLLLAISNIKDNFSLPLIAKFGNDVGESPKAICTIMSLSENTNAMFETPLPYDGTLTITMLTESEIRFELDSKGGNATLAEKPNDWKIFTGKFTLKNPVVVASGIEKNQIFK